MRNFKFVWINQIDSAFGKNHKTYMAFTISPQQGKAKMKDVLLKIPNAIKEHRNARPIIAFEGVDGCGKSSLCAKLEEQYDNVRFVKIPLDYVTSPFKDYLSFKASHMANALIYIGSLIDRKEISDSLDSNFQYIVMDRSIWSTLAISYARGYNNTQEIIDVMSELTRFLPIPDLVYVLDVPYHINRERISLRAKEYHKFDEMELDEYKKHMFFYHWLEKQDVGVKIVKQNFTNSISENATFVFSNIRMEFNKMM